MSSDDTGTKPVNGPSTGNNQNHYEETFAENTRLKEYIIQLNEHLKEQCRSLEKVKLPRETEYVLTQDLYQKIREAVIKLQEQIGEKDCHIKELEKRLTDAGIVSVHFPPSSSDSSLSQQQLASDESVPFQRIRELEIKVQELTADNEEKSQQMRQKELTMRDLQNELDKAHKLQNDRVLQLTQEYQLSKQNLLRQLDSVSSDLQMGRGSQSSQEIKTLKEQMVALVQDVQTSHTQLKALSREKNDLAQSCYLLEKQLKVSRAEKEDLKEKDDILIEDLRRRIEKLETQLALKEKERSETENRLQSMTKRYEQSRSQVGGETPTTAGLTDKIANMQEQLDMANVIKMSLESELFNLQKRATQAKVENDHILQRSKALENENVLLKFQADTYRTDFEVERSEREKTAGTMDSLRDQIAELQLRNQQLQDEIKMAMDQAAARHQQQQQHHHQSNAWSANPSSYPRLFHQARAFLGDDEADGRSHRLAPDTAAVQKAAGGAGAAEGEGRGGFLPYPCPCGRSFPTASLLQEHLDNCRQF